MCSGIPCPCHRRSATYQMWTWLLTMSVVRNTGWRTMPSSNPTQNRAATPSTTVATRSATLDEDAAEAGGRVLSTVGIGSSVEGSTVARGQLRLLGVATGYGAAALAMPIAALHPSPS